MATAPKSPQFKRHPVAIGGRSVLSAESAVVAGVSSVGGDVLLIAPPSASNTDANGGSVVREITGNNTPVVVRVTDAVGLIAGDFIRLVYKAEGGREVIVSEVGGPLGQGAVTFMSPNSSFVMSPNDLGLFLRVVQTVPLAAITVDAIVQVFDVRGPVRIAADIDAVEAIVAAGGSAVNADLVYENEAEGDVAVSLYGEEVSVGSVHNYDTVDHTYQLFATDGTTTIEISDTTAAGAGTTIPAKSAVALVPFALPPGWSLKMSLGQAVVTFAPRVILSPTMTNFDTARDDQAGAF